MGLSVAQSLLGSLGRSSDASSFDGVWDDSGFFGDGLGRLVSGTWGKTVVILSTMLVLEFVYVMRNKLLK
jgi:hypothetical protein